MNTARFLKYVWPFYNITHERVKFKLLVHAPRILPLLLFNIMNGQQCCRVNHNRPLIPLWPQPFEILVHYPRQPPSVPLDKILVYISCKSGYSWKWGIDNFHRPCFFRKVYKFRFLQIFNSWCFSNGNETQSQNLLIARWKPNRFGHSGLYDQNSFVSIYRISALWVWVSSLPWFFRSSHPEVFWKKLFLEI